MTAITPEVLRVKRYCSRYAAGTESYRELREWHGDPDEGTAYVLATDYDAALEELARLKAPVDVAGLVKRLRDDAADCDSDSLDAQFCIAFMSAAKLEREAATALESLAAQVAEITERLASVDASHKRTIELQAAQLSDARRLLALAAKELPHCSGPVHERIGVYRLKHAKQIERAEQQLAEREAEIVKIKGHAEAMALPKEGVGDILCYHAAVDAYRKDFKKDGI